MRALTGASLPVFLLFTVLLAGGAGIAMGQAMARAWRPRALVVVYALLLGGGDRFLVLALFGGPLLSISGYLVDTTAVMALALAAYQATRAYRMVTQYPWIYERTGIFGWRERRHGSGAAPP
jgi:hypothetical protein